MRLALGDIVVQEIGVYWKGGTGPEGVWRPGEKRVSITRLCVVTGQPDSPTVIVSIWFAQPKYWRHNCRVQAMYLRMADEDDPRIAHAWKAKGAPNLDELRKDPPEDPDEEDDD